jgi:hypothetical protein
VWVAGTVVVVVVVVVVVGSLVVPADALPLVDAADVGDVGDVVVLVPRPEAVAFAALATRSAAEAGEWTVVSDATSTPRPRALAAAASPMRVVARRTPTTARSRARRSDGWFAVRDWRRWLAMSCPLCESCCVDRRMGRSARDS